MRLTRSTLSPSAHIPNFHASNHLYRSCQFSFASLPYDSLAMESKHRCQLALNWCGIWFHSFHRPILLVNTSGVCPACNVDAMQCLHVSFILVLPIFLIAPQLALPFVEIATMLICRARFTCRSLA